MRTPPGTIKWIEEWFASQCNGDWEHGYAIRIETLDNPGWHVRINIAYTEWEGTSVPGELIETSENDWYHFKVESDEFVGYGDPSKLEFLLHQFRLLIEASHSHPHA